MPGAVDVFSRGSKVLLDWIRNPWVDRLLGRKGLLEVAGRGVPGQGLCHGLGRYPAKQIAGVWDQCS